MQVLLRGANIALGIVNITLFVFWLSLIRKDLTITTGQSSHGYILEHLSVQITVLETVFALVGVALAVLGIFGYQLVVERAEIRADKTAREVVAALHQNGALIGNRGHSSSPEDELPDVAAVNVTGAQKEKA